MLEISMFEMVFVAITVTFFAVVLAATE